MQVATFFTPDFNLLVLLDALLLNGPDPTRSRSQSMKSFSLEKCDDEGETKTQISWLRASEMTVTRSIVIPSALWVVMHVMAQSKVG